MRWLLVAGAGRELAGAAAVADGLGHAVRCAEIAAWLRGRGQDVELHIVGQAASRDWIAARGVTPVFHASLRSLDPAKPPDVIILDCNHVDLDWLARRREEAVVLSLAPRSNANPVVDAGVFDVEPPVPPGPGGRSYVGLEYVILPEAYRRLREHLHGPPEHRRPGHVVVAMGGVDHEDLTSQVMRRLFGADAVTHVTVVVGPAYPHERNLRGVVAGAPWPVTVCRAPSDMAAVLARSEMGIFAAGLTGYEAAAVGVPGIHVARTPFHLARARALEEAGAGLAVDAIGGLMDGIDLGERVQRVLSRPGELRKLRSRALGLIDGAGVERLYRLAVALCTSRDASISRISGR